MRISAIIAAHDPLEPWLTESHWDSEYWLREAATIASRLMPQMSVKAVREVVVEVLTGALPLDTSNLYVSERLDAIAGEAWKALHPPAL